MSYNPVSPATIAVPEYDEDPEENFDGPSFLEEAYYEGEVDGYFEEPSGAQSDAAQVADTITDPGLGSQNTQEERSDFKSLCFLGRGFDPPPCAVGGRRVERNCAAECAQN